MQSALPGLTDDLTGVQSTADDLVTGADALSPLLLRSDSKPDSCVSGRSLPNTGGGAALLAVMALGGALMLRRRP